MTHERMPTIVLTGGPCAGKTSALAHLAEWLSEIGFTPIIASEAATEIFTAGFHPTLFRDPLKFQKYVLCCLRDREVLYHSAVTHFDQSLKPVLLCDRGALDGKAYMSDADFERLCADNLLSEVHLRDTRYDAVIHMRTAALGAEDYYTLETNSARTETPEEARALDEATLRAWIGHPHVAVIPNRAGKTFDHKLTEVRQAVARVLGIPEPLEIERRFLVDRSNLDISTLSERHVVWVDIVQTYLESTGTLQERVRQRGQNGRFVFFHTQKGDVRPGVRIEHERIITSAHYESLLLRSDADRAPIRKRRGCIVFEDQYLELDLFRGRHENLAILEVELTSEHDTVSIPPYIPVIREITDDPSYSNATLALR